MNDRSEGIKAWLLKLEIASPDVRAKALIRLWKVLWMLMSWPSLCGVFLLVSAQVGDQEPAHLDHPNQ